MRVPVYRNLDSPFQVGGFKPLELVFICCFFVIASELSGTLGFSRVWAILLTFAAAGSVYWTRRSLGDEFPAPSDSFSFTAESALCATILDEA